MEDSAMTGSTPTDVHGESFRVLSKATALLRVRYPDYDSFHDEMVRLMRCFKPGEGAVDVYLEGLYLIAKFASQSQAPMRCPDEAWMLANRKAEPANQPSGLQ